MKYLYLLLIATLLFSRIKINAQNTIIPDGAYKDITEFQKRKPFINNTRFSFKPSTQKDIYWVHVVDKKIPVDTFPNLVWIIYQDSSLYINLKKKDKGFGFAKMLIFGRFSLYRGYVKLSDAHVKRRENLAIEIFYTHKNLKDKIEKELYILDLKNGRSKKVSESNMYSILKNDKEIFNQYRREKEKESIEIISRYLRLLNEKLPEY